MPRGDPAGRLTNLFDGPKRATGDPSSADRDNNQYCRNGADHPQDDVAGNLVDLREVGTHTKGQIAFVKSAYPHPVTVDFAHVEVLDPIIENATAEGGGKIKNFSMPVADFDQTILQRQRHERLLKGALIIFPAAL